MHKMEMLIDSTITLAIILLTPLQLLYLFSNWIKLLSLSQFSPTFNPSTNLYYLSSSSSDELEAACSDSTYSLSFKTLEEASSFLTTLLSSHSQLLPFLILLTFTKLLLTSQLLSSLPALITLSEHTVPNKLQIPLKIILNMIIDIIPLGAAGSLVSLKYSDANQNNLQLYTNCISSSINYSLYYEIVNFFVILYMAIIWIAFWSGLNDCVQFLLRKVRENRGLGFYRRRGRLARIAAGLCGAAVRSGTAFCGVILGLMFAVGLVVLCCNALYSFAQEYVALLWATCVFNLLQIGVYYWKRHRLIQFGILEEEVVGF